MSSTTDPKNMAYRLKTVRYQNSDRKILLQNENGPCPLLAAANALLLRGVISLPPVCIRNDVASLDDIVNMLAERALAATDDASTNNNQEEGHHHHHHHLDELMTLFPKLQYGMDVNPKFTCGPTGVEYTSNLTAFDLLNVELVHGWLLDPQDQATHNVVGGKTYNELIELVVHGNEASHELERVGKEISEKEEALKHVLASSDEDEEWVNVAGEETPATDKVKEETTSAVGSTSQDAEKKTDTDEAVAVETSEPSLQEETTPAPETSDAEPAEPNMTREEQKKKLEQELNELRTKYEELSTLATNASLVDAFLSSSSHQLTHYGLHELYNFLGEEALCVFFRNNHFATLTKKNGVLYLLVTDLGYANVPDVVWEKLDGIDGDTEYVSSLFAKPAPQKELLPTGGALSPEQTLAQRGQAEADYQLALELSKHSGTAASANLDEAEGKLMAAATEASLRTYNKVPEEQVQVSNADSTAESAGIAVPPGGIVDGCTTQEDSDKLIAMQLQAQESQEDASMQLARKLQNEELAAARARNGNNGGSRARPLASSSASTGSGCVIS